MIAARRRAGREPRRPVLVLAACLALCAQPFAAVSAQTPAAAEAQTLRVLGAKAGLFAPPGHDAAPFTPSATLPLKDGQAFGWKMTVQTQKKRVLVREELTAPAEPRTWGDPEPDLKRKTSPDGRTVITEMWLDVRDGAIAHAWTVTEGDPKGAWVFRVRVDGQPERILRLEAR